MAGKKFVLLLTFVGALTLALAGCGSSDDTTAPAVDTAPPAVPYNLAIDFVVAGNYIQLTWDENVVDADYVGVLVSRSINGAAAVQLTPTVFTQESYRDYSPGVGTNVYYVVAVDESGNQSAAASRMIVRADHHAPDVASD